MGPHSQSKIFCDSFKYPRKMLTKHHKEVNITILEWVYTIIAKTFVLHFKAQWSTHMLTKHYKEVRLCTYDKISIAAVNLFHIENFFLFCGGIHVMN